MSFTVTDVCRHGASTITFRDRSAALSRYAMCRAKPHIRYVQVTEDGGVIRQFVRHCDPTVANLEIEA